MRRKRHHVAFVVRCWSGDIHARDVDACRLRFGDGTLIAGRRPGVLLDGLDPREADELRRG